MPAGDAVAVWSCQGRRGHEGGRTDTSTCKGLSSEEPSPSPLCTPPGQLSLRTCQEHQALQVQHPFVVVQIGFVSGVPVRGRISLLPPAGLVVLSVAQGPSWFPQHLLSPVLSPALSLEGRPTHARGRTALCHLCRCSDTLLLVFFQWEVELMGHTERTPEEILFGQVNI